MNKRLLHVLEILAVLVFTASLALWGAYGRDFLLSLSVLREPGTGDALIGVLALGARGLGVSLPILLVQVLLVGVALPHVRPRESGLLLLLVLPPLFAVIASLIVLIGCFVVT